MTPQTNIAIHPREIVKPRAGSLARQAEQPHFSALEWQVIALAERDRLSTIREPGRLAAAMGSLFGGHPNARLADERLEALRRMAVLLWHERTPTEEDLAQFAEIGFSQDHLSLLRRSVVRRQRSARYQGAFAPPIGFGHSSRQAIAS